MTKDKLRPVGEDEIRSLRDMATRLLRRRLQSVHYVEPNPNEDLRGDESLITVIDRVENSIYLGFADGETLVITWGTPGFTQGLSIRLEAEFDELANGIDVGSKARWARCLGAQITDVAIAWMLCDTTRPRTAWSIRLTFSNGQSVTIALGELADNDIKLSANTLVVIFDDEIAKTFGRTEWSDSAFGQVIASSST